MNKRLVCAILLGALWAVAPAQAGFELPKKVYTIDHLAEAKQAAQEKDRPLAFLYSDKSTTCSLCIGSSLGLVEEFEKKAVFVYFSFEEKSKVPREVLAELNKPETGNVIPKVAFFDPTATKPIAVISQTQMNEGVEKAFKEARKKLSEFKKDSAS